MHFSRQRDQCVNYFNNGKAIKSVSLKKSYWIHTLLCCSWLENEPGESWLWKKLVKCFYKQAMKKVKTMQPDKKEIWKIVLT